VLAVLFEVARARHVYDEPASVDNAHEQDGRVNPGHRNHTLGYRPSGFEGIGQVNGVDLGRVGALALGFHNELEAAHGVILSVGMTGPVN
jgi:hypothetical protein